MPEHTHDPAVWSELFAAAIDAAVSPERWRDLCDRIAAAHGQAAFMVFAYDLQRHAAPLFYGSRVLWEEAAPFRRDLETGANPGDAEAYAIMSRMPAGYLVTEAACYGLQPEDPPPPNPWRDGLLAAVGAEARFAMKLNDVGPQLDAAVYHARTGDAATLAYLSAEARLLHPLLAKTLETSRTLAALTRSYDALLDLFDRLDFAVAFCDRAGRVRLANAHLRALAGERNGLHLAGGILQAESAEAGMRMAACLDAALRGETAPGALVATLPRRDGRSPLLLRAAPIRERQVSRDETLVILLVLDPEDDARISAEGLAAFGLLTAAELEVCELLVRGTGTEGIAERRSTSLETARDQIKAAQAKLGCSSRLDLLRLALVTSAPLKSGDHPPGGG